MMTTPEMAILTHLHNAARNTAEGMDHLLGGEEGPGLGTFGSLSHANLDAILKGAMEHLEQARVKLRDLLGQGRAVA